MEPLISTDSVDDSQKKEEKNITVSVTEDGFPQIAEFSDGDFPEFINKAFEKQGYKKPTPIQSHVWPIAFKGRDIVGIAQTGSGKTLAYGLPSILHINNQEHNTQPSEPLVLVLGPTRELVQQINAVFQDFLFGSSITNTCIFGGASKESQLYNINKGSNILIATPGRLIDFLESRVFTLKRCSFLVLDEADRMLDMGFEPQIKAILKRISSDRQTLMFSATWPEEVRSLAEEFLSNYVQVNVGAEQLSANHNIKQIVEVMEEAEKDEKLLEYLKNIMSEQEKKTIIFAATKVRVTELYTILKNEGFSVISMHGDKSQSEREYALKQFRDGICPILVATDVAARGLDVDDIKFVINVDYPNSSEDYVHRIGRTARVNNSGTAYTFFTFQDMKQAKDLVDILTEAKQDINPVLINLVEMSKTFGFGRSLTSCSLGSGRYQTDAQPKKKNKNPKNEQNFEYKDRDSYRNWNRDNKGWSHNNRNWDRDNNRNWDRDNNRNRDRDNNRNWDRDNNRSWDRDNNRSWNRGNSRNWNRDNSRNWNRDKGQNWNRDKGQNWNRNNDNNGDRDYRVGDRDYRNGDRDNYGKYETKPKRYSNNKNTFFHPYDSHNDSKERQHDRF